MSSSESLIPEMQTSGTHDYTSVQKKRRSEKSNRLYQFYHEQQLRRRNRVTRYSKMSLKDNFFEEFSSAESVLSTLKPNWSANIPTASLEHLRSIEDDQCIPTSGIPLKRGFSTYSQQTIEIGDEDEVILPRTFMTYGIDWDSELEEANYGTDVVVISESESEDSSSTRSFSASPSLVQYSSSGVRLNRETSSRVLQRSDDPSKHKLTTQSRNKVDVVHEPSLVGQEISSRFLSELEKLSARRGSQGALKKLYQEKLMNLEAQKKAPKRAPGQAWKAHDPEAIEIMRRSTVEHLHRAISGRKSFSHSKSSMSPDADLESLMSGKLYVKRITRELGSTDLRKHIVISNETMNGFCFTNENKTIDLRLQGKEVYNKIGRRVQDFDLPYIFAYLIMNRDIAGLDLSYNEITTTGAWYIMDFLSWNTTLKSLNLMNNDINGLDSHMIDAICQNQTLKSLRLNGNPLGKQGGEYIAFLLMFKELELLDIGQTDQNIQSLAWIAQALMQVENLKVLDLSRILGYPRYVSDSLHYALAFSDILRFCSSLVELHLQKNDLTDVDLEQILFGLSFNKTLELLDLGCNRIGDLGGEMIADALQYGAPLKALMLSTNSIANSGARALSLKLPFSQIKLLDLADNKIGDQGIIDIVQTIVKPYPLLALFIFGNNMTSRCIEILQTSILEGRLNRETIDITLYYIDGNIGYGRNTAINRYRARYYRTDNARFKSKQLAKKTPTDSTCKKPGLRYKYHNIVNAPEKFGESNAYSLGPACPV